MDVWNGWPLQRIVYLFVGIAFILIWLQVLLFHWRGAFRHWPMWGPVTTGPILAFFAVFFAFDRSEWVRVFLVIFFVLGLIEGVLGIYYHFRGVWSYIGGIRLRNLMVGPPVIMPMLFLAFTVLVLAVLIFWPVGGAL